MTDEAMAEEYYYTTYPVALNIGEEERKKRVTDIYLAGLKAGSQLDKVWQDYDPGEGCYDDTHEGKWVKRWEPWRYVKDEGFCALQPLFTIRKQNAKPCKDYVYDGGEDCQP